MIVSNAPFKLMILANISILLKIIIQENNNSKRQELRLRFSKPIPNPVEVAAVTNTNTRTSKDFVDFPCNKLHITAIIVIKPIRISIIANIIIPNLCFIKLYSWNIVY